MYVCKIIKRKIYPLSSVRGTLKMWQQWRGTDLQGLFKLKARTNEAETTVSFSPLLLCILSGH